MTAKEIKFKLEINQMVIEKLTGLLTGYMIERGELIELENKIKKRKANDSNRKVALRKMG